MYHLFIVGIHKHQITHKHRSIFFVALHTSTFFFLLLHFSLSHMHKHSHFSHTHTLNTWATPA
uniref:Uncharacterized protein n=1 Tax=Arundo donax TaxID=35708 RepID=A0A0A9TB88_ARUDO